MDIYDRLNGDKESLKLAVKAYWEQEPCESRAGTGQTDRCQYFKAIDE